MLKEIADTLKRLKPHAKSQLSFKLNEYGSIQVCIEAYSNSEQLHREEAMITLESLEYSTTGRNSIIESMLNRINSKL